MKKTTLTATAILAAAAFTGLLTGTANAATMAGVSAARPGSVTTSVLAGTKATNLADMPATAPAAKHDCKGKNDCKGTGGCGSSDAGCKGKNTCKGKGGCSTKG